MPDRVRLGDRGSGLVALCLPREGAPESSQIERRRDGALLPLPGYQLKFVSWKRGRVVDCTGLENRRWETIREFESHRFRQDMWPH
jgi:hypothetical protein